MGQQEELTQEPEIDIDETLSAVYDEAVEREDVPRDEQGKFAPKAKEVEIPIAAPDAPPEQAQAPATEIKAPASWPKEGQEAFKTLPPAIQQIVLKREADRERFTNTKAQEAAEARKSLAAIEQITAPYQALIAAEGGNAHTVVQNMLYTAAQLRQNPAAAIQALAQRYGVALGGKPNPPSAADQRLMALEQKLYQQELTQKQRQEQELSSMITAFAEEKDGDQLKRPHFEAVRDLMSVYLSSGKAPDLQSAYDMAVWANPEIRTSLIEQQQKAAEAKRIEDQKKTATAAKKAAGTHVKSRDGLPVSDAPGSMEETLAKAYERATAT